MTRTLFDIVLLIAAAIIKIGNGYRKLGKQRHSTKHLKFIMLLNAFALSVFADRAEALDCDQQHVCTINKTIRDDQGRERTMPYNFQFLPPEPGKPTIVYVPGGPGLGSMDSDAEYIRSQELKLPAGYGLILTDPRFMGRNADASIDFSKFKNEISTKKNCGRYL